MYKLAIIVLLCVRPLQLATAEVPTASALLERFAASQEKRRSFRLKYEDQYHGKSKLSFKGQAEKVLSGGYIGELRSDGRRHYSCEKSWERNRPHMSQSKEAAKADPRYRSFLWDGTNKYQYLRSNAGPEWDKLFLMPKGHADARGDDMIAPHRSRVLFGFFEDTQAKAPYGYQRIDEQLRQAGSISVQQKMQDVGGSKCYVISARTKDSRYEIWIDPEHGYNIAKAEIFRGGEGVKFGKPEEISLSTYLKNVRFEKIDAAWVPMEADCGFHWKLIYESYLKEDHHHKITELTLAPSHEALRSFEPSYIRNGTTTYLIGRKGST